MSPTPPVAAAESQVRQRVRAALAAGRMTDVDPATGQQQSLYALCPSDGKPAPVRRVARGSEGRIDQVTMRCAHCATEFVPPAEALFYR